MLYLSLMQWIYNFHTIIGILTMAENLLKIFVDYTLTNNVPAQ